jgi:cob(I)alamin adenosyltransferase
MPSFYTRGGDEGFTGLLGDMRVSKSDLRMEVLGSIDEVNASLGMARSLAEAQEIKEIILKVQRDLYSLMGEIAATAENASVFRVINHEHVDWLEKNTDRLTSLAKVPREFIVPGDTPSSAALDVARTVVRRAERRSVDLYQQKGFANPEILRYLNRLSSLCFVMELFENQTVTGKEKPTLAIPGTE